MPHDGDKWLSSINFSTQVIADVINWLQTGAYPAYIATAEQSEHYDNTFSDFTVQNGDLYYGTRQAIPEDDPTEQRDRIKDV